MKKEYIEQHIEDIEGFVDILESHNITVRRPDTIKKLQDIKTPHWKGQTCLTGPLNARDLCIVVGDTIIECPVEIRGRYFETDCLKPLFKKYFDAGSKWVCAPKPMMLDESYTSNFEMMLDAARCMRLGTDIIVNVNSECNRLGAEWLRRTVGDQYTVHEVTLCDGHIDAVLVPLRPGLMLLNTVYVKDLNMLPEKFRNWDFVEVEYHEDYDNKLYAENDVLLASPSIDCNVLSIDPNTIICHSHSHQYLQSKLKKYNIECVPCRLRHSRLFDGAFHCLTLDVNRSGILETY